MNKTLTVNTSSENQFSCYILDHLKPCQMPTPNDKLTDDSLINGYLKPFIQTIKFIMDLGEKEHTGDWDPCLIITLWDDTKLFTENGYYTMEIKGNYILIEDEIIGAPVNYMTEHKLLISTIKSIELTR